MEQVEFSHRDRKMGIKVPEAVTPDVAELTGIITARGHLKDAREREAEPFIEISGSAEDKPYLEKHVVELMKRTFNAD